MCIINQYPGIKVCALDMAYDNGMINRNVSEQKWLASQDYVLGATGVDSSDLAELDEFCCALSKEQRDALHGEEQESNQVQNLFQKPELFGLFDDMFSNPTTPI